MTAGESRNDSTTRAASSTAWLATIAGIVTAAFGAVALVGWLLGVPLLASLVPGDITMKVNTAAVLVVFGLALPALASARPVLVWLGRVGLLAVIAVVSTILSQYITGLDLGVDQFLVPEPPGTVGTVVPGRMSPQTAISLLGLAFAALIARRVPWLVFAAAGVAMSLAGLNVLDRLYGAVTPSFLAAYTQMAVPTAAALVSAAAGVLALLPDQGRLGALLGSTSTAGLTRRLVAAAVVIPVGLGWLRLQGERMGLYGTAFGVAIMSLAGVTLFLFAIWITTRANARAEQRSLAARASLETSLAELRRMELDRERALTDAEHARQEAVAARQRAESADRAKSEFLSRMSHELRTPLNSVLGFAQLLEMEQLAERQLESVRYISRAGRHLLELINEVLDLSRIETGSLALSPEPVSMNDLIEEVVPLVQRIADPAKVTITVDPSGPQPYVIGDRQRVRQVLLNLIGNAVKYNRSGGRVTITTELRGPVLRVSVADTGYGIAGDELARLFQPFERLGERYGEIEGTGVGLSLSKGLVEAMHGRIGVESTPGVGSTFWFELAATEGPLERHDRLTFDERAERSVTRVDTRTVLHVEDNVSNHRLVERILGRRPGMRVLHASTGVDGLAVIERERVDLILLDLHLPDLPGTEVLRRLRGSAATERTPVLVVSADATDGQRSRLLAAGAQAYLTKPLDVRAFLEAVDAAVPTRDTGTPDRTLG